MTSPKTTLSMFVVVVAAAAAAGCGPADRSSSLRASSGDNGAPVGTSTTSAPAAPVTPRATTRPKPRPVAPKPVASAPKPTPTPTPVAKPRPKPKPAVRSTCGAPANPWDYNFCGRGSYVYSPATGVCDYFACIGNFDNGSGYMVQCNDGMYSMSGGRSGACSHHSGEGQPVYGGP